MFLLHWINLCVIHKRLFLSPFIAQTQQHTRWLYGYENDDDDDYDDYVVLVYFRLILYSWSSCQDCLIRFWYPSHPVPFILSYSCLQYCKLSSDNNRMLNTHFRFQVNTLFNFAFFYRSYVHIQITHFFIFFCSARCLFAHHLMCFSLLGRGTLQMRSDICWAPFVSFAIHVMTVNWNTCTAPFAR